MSTHASRYAAHLKALERAVNTYDQSGGLAHDAQARRRAIEKLARDLDVPDDAAAELLADALARRAALNPNQLKED